MFKSFKTIKNNIIFTYILVFTSTLLLLNILVYFLSINIVVKIKKDVFNINKKTFINNIQALEKKNIVISRENLEIEINKIREHSLDFYIRIINNDGVQVGEFPLDTKVGLIEYNKIILLEGNNHEEYFYSNEIFQYQGSDHTLQFLLVTNYEEYFKVLIYLFIIVEFLGLFVALITGVRIANKVVLPLNMISDITENITAQNLGERLPFIHQSKEFLRLTKIINRMLERLEISFNDQKNFLSNISHELKTPIAVMKGYLDLYREVGSNNKDLLEEAITAIEEENENMKRMIEKLLFIARKDINKFKFNIERVNVETLFEKLDNDYKHFKPHPGFKINVAPGSYLECDQDILLQILRALIDNAMKYGGKDKIELGYYKTKSKKIIYVRDFGEGIEERDIDKIFKKFYKGNKSSNRDSCSIGLGLSLVKSLAELHGLKIDVKSKINEGSTFQLEFISSGGDNEKNISNRG